VNVAKRKSYMTKLYNLKTQTKLRRILRKQPIQAERMLWYKIRKNQLGYKFRRQYGVDKYVLDFYCPRLKFAIELDGATHASEHEIKYDEARQKYIENTGITVKRYSNSEIRNNIDEVLENISVTCMEISRKQTGNNTSV
jgi:very-short-patch-repair endonuclease